jgi:hypothetical protein
VNQEAQKTKCTTLQKHSYQMEKSVCKNQPTDYFLCHSQSHSDIKNIHPKYIKVYTDIDPTVDFVFPVNKIDRENSEKIVF